MGKYDVDFSKKEIIVDGHLCVETEYKGVYEVQGDFKVTIDMWFHNSLNRNLSALYVYNGDMDSLQSVLYVVRYDNDNMKRFINDKEKLGVILSEMICTHCDGAIVMGGLVTW